MPAYCTAYGCTNSNAKQRCIDGGISFHQYPLNDKCLLRRWLLNIRRANFVPNIFSKICSEHFEEKYFKYQNFSKRRQLKKNAVPTKFCFSQSKRNERIPSLKVDLYELDEDDGNCSDCGCIECISKKNNVINLRKMELPQYDRKKGLWLKSITPLQLLKKETVYIHKYEAEKEASEMKEIPDSYVQLNNLENKDEILERNIQGETEVWSSSTKKEKIDLEKVLDQQASMNTDPKESDKISLTSDEKSDRLKYFIFPSSSSNLSNTNYVSHREALKAVQTLMCYMENQEDVDNADLIRIDSYREKILENMKKRTQCKS